MVLVPAGASGPSAMSDVQPTSMKTRFPDAVNAYNEYSLFLKTLRNACLVEQKQRGKRTLSLLDEGYKIAAIQTHCDGTERDFVAEHVPGLLEKVEERCKQLRAQYDVLARHQMRDPESQRAQMLRDVQGLMDAGEPVMAAARAILKIATAQLDRARNARDREERMELPHANPLNDAIDTCAELTDTIDGLERTHETIIEECSAVYRNQLEEGTLEEQAKKMETMTHNALCVEHLDGGLEQAQEQREEMMDHIYALKAFQRAGGKMSKGLRRGLKNDYQEVKNRVELMERLLLKAAKGALSHADGI